MPEHADWATYLSARSAALSRFADPNAVTMTIDRAAARLRTYLDDEPDSARVQARRCLLYATDAAFHDQLLASGDIELLHALVGQTGLDDRQLLCDRLAGAVAVSLHYGPATSILPLWLAKASRMGMIGTFAVIQNSRNNPNVMLSAERHAELGDRGFPFEDLDIARLGELGALRRALRILRNAGTVLIFADGQLPPPGTKRIVTCRLGEGSIALAHGPEWLARSADVPLLPLLLRPKRNGNELVSFPVSHSGTGSEAIQVLFDAAMAFDPAPWSCWCSRADHL